MASKDTPIHQFLFPQGMPDTLRAKFLPRASMAALLPNIGPELKSAVETDIQKSSDSLLAMTPMDVILQGWKRYREVGRALEDSRKKPGESILKALLNHTVKSTHKPYVEIFLEDVSVGKVPFELLISFNVEGVTLKILNGGIMSVMSGSFQGTIKLSLVGETLAEMKTQRIELSGTLDIGGAPDTQPLRREPDPAGAQPGDGSTATTARHKSDAIPARLRGLEGASAGQSFFLADNQTIGRAAENGIVLEDKSVSRQHARVRYSEGVWHIQDMGSSMGVFVNDVKTDASPLKEGDRVRLGMSEFEFRE